MKERHIRFSGPMVRAILEGKKTMTRLVISKKYGEIKKVIESSLIRGEFHIIGTNGQSYYAICPYGLLGNRLWVKETFRLFDRTDECGCVAEFCQCPKDGAVIFRATGDDGESKWKPSTFMPRWASRILLEIVDVRIERLQDISEEDAEREGIDCCDFDQSLVLDMANKLNQPIEDSRPWFAALWDGINGKAQSKCWDANPWVWAIEFKRIN